MLLMGANQMMLQSTDNNNNNKKNHQSHRVAAWITARLYVFVSYSHEQSSSEIHNWLWWWNSVWGSTRPFPFHPYVLTHIHTHVTISWSYRPFVPLRNLWSRRDILPTFPTTQLADRSKDDPKKSQRRVSHPPNMCWRPDAACTLTASRRCLSCFTLRLPVCSSPPHSLSLFNVKRSCVRKKPDLLTPAGQSPSAGCWGKKRKKDPSRYRSSAPPSLSCYLGVCRLVQDTVTLLSRVHTG